MAMNGTITLVSNQNSGQVSTPQIAKGTTVKDVLYSEYGASVDPDKFMVNINGGDAITDLAGCKLKDKDFVVVSPKNLKGN